MARLLVVDDEFSIRNVLNTLLVAGGHEVVAATDGTDALKILRQTRIDLVLSDIVMEPMSGMELLRKVRIEFPRLPVILLTGCSSLNTASEALSLGVFDYLMKPINIAELQEVVKHALEATTTDVIATKSSTADYEKLYRLGGLVAGSTDMQELCNRAEQCVASGANALICGEKGTGKKAMAAAIRALISKRRARPLATINCAESPEPVLDAMLLGGAETEAEWNESRGKGILWSDAGGIMILQEVDMLPHGTQRKLVKAFRKKQLKGTDPDGAVEAPGLQVLSLADRSIESIVEGGLILPDLLSLIGVFRFEIKPLRERPDDIVPLVVHFFRQNVSLASRVPAIDAELCETLVRYSWPGNVAELQKAVEHMSLRVKDGRLTISNLPEDLLNHIAQSRTDLSADYMKSEHWASLLKKYLRIVCVDTVPDREASGTGKPEMSGGDGDAWKGGSVDVSLSSPHELFPFWSRAQLYDRVTAMYLDFPDDREIARSLSADLRLELTEATISAIRVEAALAAERQPHAVKRRWIYRYRRLTVNNLVKEFMFMEDKHNFLKAKRELAEEIVALVRQTPPDKLCIAVNDALGRNNIGADLIHKLEAYGHCSRKMRDAAKSYAVLAGLDDESALLRIADKLAVLHATECNRDLGKTALALAKILKTRSNSIDGNDVTFFLEYHNLANEDQESARSFMSRIVSGSDVGIGLQSVLQQVLDGVSHHIPRTGIANLIEIVRSNLVMERSDLEQVRDYAVRHARDLETSRKLQHAARLPDNIEKSTIDELGTLERLVSNHLSLLSSGSFFSKAELTGASRRNISSGDLQAVLDRLNRLETEEEITQLATSLFAGRGFAFPTDRYLDRRFRLTQAG